MGVLCSVPVLMRRMSFFETRHFSNSTFAFSFVENSPVTWEEKNRIDKRNRNKNLRASISAQDRDDFVKRLEEKRLP